MFIDKKHSIKNRPKVILVGNGIPRLVQSVGWDKLINDMAEEKLSLPDETPYSLQATLKLAMNDKDRHLKYYDRLKPCNYKYKNNEVMHELLKCNADAFLTTNYTYDLEHELDNDYANYSDNKKRKYAITLGKTENSRVDAKYLINTYNKIENQELGCKEIWHIHGEHRRKSSMILTHDEYIKLIAKEVDYLHKKSNYYEENKNDIKISSWIDYLILGELYVIGYGLHFSEFDMWWIINRRLRENVNKNNMPKIYFYEYYSVQDKDDYPPQCEALKKIGAEVITYRQLANKSGIKLNKKLSGEDYNQFYDLAIKDIQKRTKK